MSFPQFQAAARALAPKDHHVRVCVEAWAGPADRPGGSVAVVWGISVIGAVGTTSWHVFQGATPESALSAMEFKLAPSPAGFGQEHVDAVRIDAKPPEGPSFQDFVDAIRGAPDGESLSFPFVGGRVNVVMAQPVAPGDPLSAAVVAPPVVHELATRDVGGSADRATP